MDSANRGFLDKLRGPEATEDDVLVYLRERSTSIVDAGGVAVPIEQYWHDGDLQRYRQAQAVWAKDAPPRFALPDLPTLLNGVAGPAGMPYTTFMDDLTNLWNGYAWWMEQEGRDPLRPNEAAKERRLRVARESMARTRERRKGADPERAALLDAAKEAHDLYLRACRARKEMLVELDATVRDAWAAYEQARDAAK